MNEPTIQPGKDCAFCKNGMIVKSFYTSLQFSAFYNIAPILPGHSLVIPNRHIESLLDLTDAELGEMMIFARKVTSILLEVFGCNGFDWSIQDGVAAGQTVPHLHLHIIPRKPLDMTETNEWYSLMAANEQQMPDSKQRGRLSNEEYDAITDRLSRASQSLQ